MGSARNSSRERSTDLLAPVTEKDNSSGRSFVRDHQTLA
jgi:hypothetical protein